MDGRGLFCTCSRGPRNNTTGFCGSRSSGQWLDWNGQKLLRYWLSGLPPLPESFSKFSWLPLHNSVLGAGQSMLQHEATWPWPPSFPPVRAQGSYTRVTVSDITALSFASCARPACWTMFVSELLWTAEELDLASGNASFNSQ